MDYGERSVDGNGFAQHTFPTTTVTHVHIHSAHTHCFVCGGHVDGCNEVLIMRSWRDSKHHSTGMHIAACVFYCCVADKLFFLASSRPYNVLRCVGKWA